MNPVTEALLDAWALVMPVECAGCGVDDRALCAACAGQLHAATSVHRLSDGTPVVAALRYEGAVRRVILALKEQQRTDVAAALARPLAAAIDRAIREAPPAVTIELLAVPTSRAAWRRRGYDPVALLARRAGFRPARGLRATRSSPVQKSLSADERRTNRLGLLRADRSMDGRAFVVVDDVLTTGATLGEAVRAVRGGGGRVVACAVVAFTPLRGAVLRQRRDLSVTLSANGTTVGEKARHV